MRHFFQIAASVVALLTFLAQAQSEPVPPPAKSIKAEETAILLVGLLQLLVFLKSDLVRFHATRLHLLHLSTCDLKPAK